MTPLLVDSSVLIKWFHAAGESELDESRRIRDAHVGGAIEAHVLDLAMYEVGNVLIKALRWPAAEVADQLDDLRRICGPPLVVDPVWLRDAAEIATVHGLTFYDAAWAAAARGLRLPLVSADRQLVRVALAESPTMFTERIRI